MLPTFLLHSPGEPLQPIHVVAITGPAPVVPFLGSFTPTPRRKTVALALAKQNKAVTVRTGHHLFY
jgi:hypothetical protein